MRPASRLTVILMATFLVSACGTPQLRDMRDSSSGPEEFSIVPNKALQTPENLSNLPTPTRGQGNLTDATPMQDAVAALGGNPARLGDTSIPASDAALVAGASRLGVSPNIRETTSAEDVDFRKRRGRFTNIRLFRTDRYGDVYKRQTLDARRTLDTFRRAGRKTPTAPPAN